jgi:hypothetical protein
VRAWFLRGLKKARELLLVFAACVLVLAFCFWIGSGLDWLSDTISGQHAGWLNSALRIFLGILALCIWMALRIMVAGGFNWPWVVRRRKRAAENFYLPAIVPLLGHGKTIQFRPRHVLFTAQPWAALGLDRDMARLRLMSLDGRGDVTIDLALVQRAVYLPGRKRWFSWLRTYDSPALRLFLHARDYHEPVFYTLLVARADKAALRRFQSVLQAALHDRQPLAMPSSQEWAAVLPRYSGAATFDNDGYWPPRPRYAYAKATTQ